MLRGGYVHILCPSSLAGTATAGELLFFDETNAQPVLPITSYHGTQTLINWVNAITPGTSTSARASRARSRTTAC